MQPEILTSEERGVTIYFPDVPMREEDGVRMYSVINVDGLPGTCGLCFRDVPAVARIESVEFDARDAGKFEKYRTTTLFVCRDDAPARAALLFDSPGRYELFNGVLQPAA
jgi:hypothetical protein